jgi:hypothetical protein
MRKIIFLVIVVILLGLALGGVYLAWQKYQDILRLPAEKNVDNKWPTTSDGKLNKEFTTNSIKQVNDLKRQSRIKALSDQPVFSYWIYKISTSSNQADIFYIREDGKIFRVQENAPDELIGESQEIKNDIQAVVISNNGRLIIVKYGDLFNPRFLLFNIDNKTWQQFINISAIAFSPDSRQVVYLDKKTSSLVIRDLFGSKIQGKTVLALGQLDFDLQWLTPDEIFFFTKPSSLVESQWWSFNLKNKNWRFLANGFGLIMQWSTDGQRGLLFNIENQNTPRLFLIDKNGTKIAEPNFMTFPHKCLLGTDNIYCAIPQFDNEGRYFQALSWPKNYLDRYLKRGVYLRDDFYQIDVRNNTLKEFPFDTDQFFDAINLSILDNKLLFINRYDKKLYSLSLD